MQRVFNVNFFCHAPPEFSVEKESVWRAALSPYFAEFGIDPSAIAAGPGRLPFNSEAAEVLAEFRPAVVSFHFGLPSADLLARVRGCKEVAAGALTRELTQDFVEAG